MSGKGKNQAETVILVRYAELGLKSSGTRIRFENTLIENIQAMLSREKLVSTITKTWGRIFITPENGNDSEKILKVLSRVFGVSSASKAHPIKDFSGLDDLSLAAASIIPKDFITKDTSFAVRARRAGTTHDFTSMDVATRLGALIVKNTGASVNLKNPDRKVFIEVREKTAYLYFETIDGPRGLPYGVEGKVVVLLSGGIDSPVAAWLAMKRGCRPVFLHAAFDPKNRTRERATNVLKALKGWIPESQVTVYFTPHASGLEGLLGSCDRRLTCVLCKRLMLRSAELVAVKECALAIVTGDSLGQVASQTLTNLFVEDAAVKKLPVLRPLVGLDKLEIENWAKQIGTYEPSTQVEVDACFAVPKHPETAASLSKVEDEEEFAEAAKIVQELVSKSERIRI